MGINRDRRSVSYYKRERKSGKESNYSDIILIKIDLPARSSKLLKIPNLFPYNAIR